MGGLEVAAQNPRSGWGPLLARAQPGDRISLWEMPSYLPVLVWSRRHPRAADSASPTRTPTAMPMMDPTGRPVVLLSSEIRRKGEGNVS